MLKVSCSTTVDERKSHTELHARLPEGVHCVSAGGGVRASASSVALDGLAGAGLGPQSHLLSWADRTFGQGLTTITKGQTHQTPSEQGSQQSNPYTFAGNSGSCCTHLAGGGTSQGCGSCALDCLSGTSIRCFRYPSSSTSAHIQHHCPFVTVMW